MSSATGGPKRITPAELRARFSQLSQRLNAPAKLTKAIAQVLASSQESPRAKEVAKESMSLMAQLGMTFDTVQSELGELEAEFTKLSDDLQKAKAQAQQLKESAADVPSDFQEQLDEMDGNLQKANRVFGEMKQQLDDLTERNAELEGKNTALKDDLEVSEEHTNDAARALATALTDHKQQVDALLDPSDASNDFAVVVARQVEDAGLTDQQRAMVEANNLRAIERLNYQRQFPRFFTFYNKIAKFPRLQKIVGFVFDAAMLLAEIADVKSNNVIVSLQNAVPQRLKRAKQEPQQAQAADPNKPPIKKVSPFKKEHHGGGGSNKIEFDSEDMLVSARTVAGKVSKYKTRDEDCFRVVTAIDKTTGEKSELYIVVDGMGGHGEGDQAARIIARTIGEEWDPADPESIINAIEKATLALQDEVNIGAGACVAIILRKGNKVYVYNVGDTRILRVKDNEIAQLTHDDGALILGYIKGKANFPTPFEGAEVKAYWDGVDGVTQSNYILNAVKCGDPHPHYMGFVQKQMFGDQQDAIWDALAASQCIVSAVKCYITGTMHEDTPRMIASVRADEIAGVAFKFKERREAFRQLIQLTPQEEQQVFDFLEQRRGLVLDLEGGETFILCSDGQTELLPKQNAPANPTNFDQFSGIVLTNQNNPSEIADQLIVQSNDNSGDNSTNIVVKIPHSLLQVAAYNFSGNHDAERSHIRYHLSDVIEQLRRGDRPTMTGNGKVQGLTPQMEQAFNSGKVAVKKFGGGYGLYNTLEVTTDKKIKWSDLGMSRRPSMDERSTAATTFNNWSQGQFELLQGDLNDAISEAEQELSPHSITITNPRSVGQTYFTTELLKLLPKQALDQAIDQVNFCARDNTTAYGQYIPGSKQLNVPRNPAQFDRYRATAYLLEELGRAVGASFTHEQLAAFRKVHSDMVANSEVFSVEFMHERSQERIASQKDFDTFVAANFMHFVILGTEMKQHSLLGGQLYDLYAGLYESGTFDALDHLATS